MTLSRSDSGRLCASLRTGVMMMRRPGSESSLARRWRKRVRIQVSRRERETTEETRIASATAEKMMEKQKMEMIRALAMARGRGSETGKGEKERRESERAGTTRKNGSAGGASPERGGAVTWPSAWLPQAAAASRS